MIHTLTSGDMLKDIAGNRAKIDSTYTERAKDVGFKNIFLAELDGSAHYNGKNINIAQTDYFKTAVSGENVVSSPAINPADNTMQIFVACPIRINNEIVAVLLGTLDANQFSNEVSNVTFGKSGAAFMIDDKATSIANKDQGLVLKQDNAIENAKTDTAFANLAKLEGQMVAGQNGVGEYTYKGVTKFMGYHSVEGTRWSIGVTAPKSEVFSSITALAWLILLASFIFLALSVFAAFVIARSISSPIKACAKFSEVLAGGDFTKEVRAQFTNRQDEIGALARAFKIMKENLNDTLLNINEASEQVASGSKQVSDSSMALSQGATEQASSIEELTASIEEIASQTKQNADNAKEANTLAESTKENADKGNTSMFLEVMV